MAKRTSHLTKLDHISMGERKLEEKKERGKREKKRRGEIGSSFSLDFSKIRPSAFVEARDKVDPRGGSFD